MTVMFYTFHGTSLKLDKKKGDNSQFHHRAPRDPRFSGINTRIGLYDGKAIKLNITMPQFLLGRIDDYSVCHIVDL